MCRCVCVSFAQKVGGRNGNGGGGGDDDNKSIFIIFFPCRAMSGLVASSSSPPPHLFFGVRWSWNEMKKKLDRFPDGYIENASCPPWGCMVDHIRSGSQCFFLYVCVCFVRLYLFLVLFYLLKPCDPICARLNCEPPRIIYYNLRVLPAREKTRIFYPNIMYRGVCVPSTTIHFFSPFKEIPCY